MVIVIDAQLAGIAGDMMLSALVDLGADRSRVIDGARDAVSALPGTKVERIEFSRVTRRGVSSTFLDMSLGDDAHARGASEIRSCIGSAASSCGVSERAASFALSSFDALVSAESRIHGVPVSSVHLHEAARADTVVDILGTAIALDSLGALGEQIVCTPVAVGGGTVTFSHGTMSNPASAILGILAGTGISIHGGPARCELTTPTGACMLASLAGSCSEFYPPMAPSAVGYGAGAADHDAFANVLKVVRGAEQRALATDRVRVLETNLDDVTGELLGHVVDTLIARGARDVTVAPAVGKKGRPASVLTAICDAPSYDAVLSALLEETGTLGVRVRDSERVLAERSLRSARVSVAGRGFEVRYKVSSSRGLKVEHEDARRIAAELGMPLRRAEELIRDGIRAAAP